MIFREVHVSCVQRNDHQLLLLSQVRDYNYKKTNINVFFLVCSSLITLRRFLSLLENIQNIYFWIAKAGSKSGRQGIFSHLCKSTVD